MTDAAILPDFFVVGAMKAGTTTVADRLADHPEVFVPRVKEPHFFADEIDPRGFAPHLRHGVVLAAEDLRDRGPSRRIHHAYVCGKASYSALFRGAEGAEAAGDFSTSYLYSARAIANIQRAVPRARIVALLRDPLDRAYSHYLMDRRIGSQRLPFRAAVEADLHEPRREWGRTPLYLDLGCYAGQVARLLDTFPRDQTLLLLYEDLADDFAGTMARICRHIGADPGRLPKDPLRANAARRPRLPALNGRLYRTGAKRAISRVLPRGLVGIGKRFYYANAINDGPTAEDRARFLPLVAEDVARLEALLDRDLSHWRQ